jgi:hypothetical protein
VSDHVLINLLHIPLVGTDEVFHLVHVHKVFAYVLGFFSFCDRLHEKELAWIDKGKLETKYLAKGASKIAETRGIRSKQTP